jgi:hypothetical protein
MDCRSAAKNKVILGLLAVMCMLATLPATIWAADRLELDATAIKGSRELPKVLYIVPWQSARLGALSGGAGSSAFDTGLEALDRDVFRRQVQYYGMLHGESGTGESGDK